MKRPRVMWFASIAAAGLVIALIPQVWLWAASAGRTLRLHDTVAKNDVGIVLGAGLTPNGRPSRYLAQRLEVARQLYSRGDIKVIIVSGDNRFVNYDEPTAMRDWLIEHGIPAAHIVADFAGRDTYDTCVRAKKIFGVDKATVITSHFHVPRTVTTCRAVGVDAVGVGDKPDRWFDRSRLWGEIRERAAIYKTVLDVISRRDPVLGQPETSVRDAIAARR